MLGTPPAFVLSQDQTLKKLYLNFLIGSSNHFLNNLLLAILLKNFRWLNFDFKSILNNLINCPRCFLVRLSRYSIYKVQSLAARAVSLLILTCLNPFVKNFFQVFSNFFLVCYYSRRPRGQLGYISICFFCCQVSIYKFLHIFSFSCGNKKEPLPRLFP